MKQLERAEGSKFPTGTKAVIGKDGRASCRKELTILCRLEAVFLVPCSVHRNPVPLFPHPNRLSIDRFSNALSRLLLSRQDSQSQRFFVSSALIPKSSTSLSVSTASVKFSAV